MKALIVEVPALHLGYLGCYGNEWVATPALDRLAAQGVAFDQHIADGLGTSRGAWTGRYHFPEPAPKHPLSPEGTPDLSALLQAAGIPIVHVPPALGRPGGSSALDRTLETVIQTLERLQGEDRWLVWAELPSLLPPWELPEEFRSHYFPTEPVAETEEEAPPPEPLLDPPTGPVEAEDFATWERLQLTYAGVVSALDAGLGFLLEEAQGRLPEGLLMVTAGRGLALGEHGIVGEYRPWLHDEVIHLPLLVRLPRGAEAGLRIPALTQPVDLYPTLLEGFGLPVPEAAHGRSLLPLIRGEVDQLRQYACASWGLKGAVEWGLRTPEWGFLLPVAVPPDDRPREPRLYVKPDDRWEVNDLRQHHLELVGHLEEVLRSFIAATRHPGPLQPPVLRDPKAEPAEAQG
jgi:arylsulfatase A-like enzyme